jgi:hypothetical protein
LITEEDSGIFAGAFNACRGSISLAKGKIFKLILQALL